MKGLTLVEPIASLAAAGVHTIEHRSWNPADQVKDARRGMRLAIHAARSTKSIDDGTAARLFAGAGLALPSWRPGCILAVVTLRDWTPTSSTGGRDGWALVLRDPRPVPPIPCPGGLFFWELPADVERQLSRALALRGRSARATTAEIGARP